MNLSLRRIRLISHRQVGFQETDAISIVKSITKFSHQLKKDNLIKILDRLYHAAYSDRQGPVLLDVPIDLQNIKIIKKKFSKSFSKKSKKQKIIKNFNKFEKLLSKSNKPLFLIGGGFKNIDKKVLSKLSKKISIPFVNTWNGFDVLDYQNKNFIGTVGIYGNRASNYAIQNCDLLIVLGSRLETRVIGRDKKNFAKNAKIVQIDIDNFELKRKRDRKIELKINSTTTDFITYLNYRIKRIKFKNDIRKWLNLLNEKKINKYNSRQRTKSF